MSLLGVTLYPYVLVTIAFSRDHHIRHLVTLYELQEVYLHNISSVLLFGLQHKSKQLHEHYYTDGAVEELFERK